MSRRLKSQVSALLVTGCLASGLVLACSGASNKGSGFDNGSSSGGSSGGSSGSNGSSSSGSGGSGGGSGGSLGGSSSSGGADPDAACAASATKGQQAPLDIYMMLDYSGSMQDQSKWTNVSNAITTFMQTPSNGVSVGLQYFGLPPSSSGGNCTNGASCQSDSDCGGSPNVCVPGLNSCLCGGGLGGDSCQASDYAKPEVEIAPMTTAGPQIIKSLQGHTAPNTGTPTSAALDGAIQHATDWAKAHTSDVTIVLLATDGDPSECDTNLGNIDKLAQTAANGNPKILTFVIGVGSSLTNLNGIAAAGGTGQAFLVDANGNAQQQFLDALNKIRGTALGCSYSIPMPQVGNPNYSAVNVQFTPAGGQPQTIPNVKDKGSCPATGDAWYYDDNANPKQIILCDATCNTVTSDKNGEVDVLLGCATVVK